MTKRGFRFVVAGNDHTTLRAAAQLKAIESVLKGLLIPRKRSGQ